MIGVDSAPTASSTNLVESGGVKTALDAKTNLSVVADNYDATSTYALGDYVIYDGALYECTTAISTAEAWNSSHWTLKDVAELISENVPNLSNYVDLTSSQTISGSKTFSANINANGGITIPANKIIDMYANNTKIRMAYSSGIEFPDTYWGYTKVIGLDNNTNKNLLINATSANGVGISMPRPQTNNGGSVGMSSYKYAKAYINQFNDGNNANYGLVLPDTTDYTANKTIATETTIDTTSTSPITLANNTSFRLGTISALTINAPSSYSLDFTCEVIFTADTGISMTYSAVSPTWSGDDVSGGVFTPVAGKTYNIIFFNNATAVATPSIQAIVRGVS